jgi:uncharacterized protein GlcG (DUF336 family)
MTTITLDQARRIIAFGITKGSELGLKPLSIVILDAGGNIRAFERQDGASNMRFQIAFGKAFGALGLGIGSRGIMARAEQQPWFITSVNGAFDGHLVPVPGGVLVTTDEGELIGAVGVSGDTSDNDEIAAVAGIEHVGFVADPG